MQYDIDITRDGTGLETRYSITPVPNKTPLSTGRAGED
jgi:hypothetical protein